jgi:hypothetical protein
MSRPAVWLHGDSLGPQDPALVANPQAPAVFVFDEPFLRTRQLAFKRLFFLYECAQEALAGRDGAIRRGVVVDELLAFCAERGCDELHVTVSVAPLFRDYLVALREQIRVVTYEPEPFVGWRGDAPRRFSAFWRKVEGEALRPTSEGPPELQ